MPDPKYPFLNLLVNDPKSTASSVVGIIEALVVITPVPEVLISISSLDLDPVILLSSINKPPVFKESIELVIVKTFPDIVASTEPAPTICNVPPSATAVPVESSPIKVIPCAGLDPLMVKVSPDTAVVILEPPTILNVSPTVTAVPVESSPTMVIAVSVFCA